MEKRDLSEREICTKFITPALRRAGWDEVLQIREEVSFTKGRMMALDRSRHRRRNPPPPARALLAEALEPTD